MEPREIKTVITHQGAVKANPGGIVYRESADIACICVDLETKYARMGGTFSGGGDPPGVVLSATEDSIHMDPAHDRDSMTFIQFPEFQGWTVFVAEVSRYTLALCMLKDKEPDNDG